MLIIIEDTKFDKLLEQVYLVEHIVDELRIDGQQDMLEELLNWVLS